MAIHHPTGRDNDRLWSDFLTRVSTMVSKQTLEAWFKPMRLSAVDDSAIVIDCPNKFLLDWVEEHHKDKICYVFGELIGGDPQVRFAAPNGLSEEAAARRIDVPVILPAKRKNGNGGEPLNPKYIFEEFVQGSNSRMAYAACQAVAENPATVYNPLFIYGGVGLGKTHLMQAIGHHLIDAKEPVKVHYSSAEIFMNELITAIRQGKSHEFREKYRNVDVLLIDDIQFLAGKESTQEEFFHTFNALHGADKQIVVTSDRPPKEIPTLEERLRSRFEWGLIADIQPPDFETRCAILKKKMEKEKRAIPEEVLTFIADNVKSNIRELEGSLVKLLVHASVYGEEITLESARTVLKDFIDHKPKKTTIAIIQKVVAQHYRVPVDSMKSPVRTASYVHPRQVAIYLSRELTTCSLTQIGQHFGGRDHTTVLHGIDKIREKMSVDVSLKSTVMQLKKELT
jgi:chromosomal replication initiator protein